MLRRLVPLVLLALVVPGSAAAQGVARDGNQTLRATARGADRVCVILRGRFELGRRCGPVPRSAWRPIRVDNQAAVGRDPYAVAVPPTVRLATIGGRRVPLVASAGGRVKLVLRPARGTPLIRFFDARGRLVGVDTSIGYRVYADDVPVFGTSRDGVRAYAQRVLDPAPGDLDRVRPLACVNTVHGSGGNGACIDEANLLPGCSEPDLVTAVLPPGLTQLQLTLRSGGQLLIPATPLPAVFGGAVVAAGLVPVGEAVTDVTALDAAGAPALAGRLGAPAAGQVCRDDDPDGAPIRDETTLQPVAVPAGTVAARAGRHVALLADLPVRGTESPRVCFGLDRLLARECRPAPVDAVPEILRRRGGALTTLLGPQAATVTARLRSDRRIVARARTPAQYGGAWRGRLRVAILRVPDAARVERLVVRDRRGSIVGERHLDRPPPPERTGPVGSQ